MKANGPIPPSIFVLHECDNRRCININHLFLGTHSDNMADMTAKGRRNTNRDPLSSAKLTPEQVLEVRASKESLTALAPRYGVSISTLSLAKRGITWSHL